MRGAVKNGCEDLVKYVFTANNFPMKIIPQLTDAAISYDFLRVVN